MASPTTMSEIYKNNSTFNSSIKPPELKSVEGKGLFEIGRPCILPNSADPKYRDWETDRKSVV